MYYCPSCLTEYNVEEAEEKDYECCDEEMIETDSNPEDDDDDDE